MLSLMVIVAYTQQPDYDTLREVNVPLMRRAVEAIDALSPALEHVILQTGGKVRFAYFTDRAAMLIVGIWSRIFR